MSEKDSSKKIRLTVEGGPTREFPGDRTFVIGRSATADFSIPHPNLSREHVRISLKDGEIILEDLGSGNGTFVQGQKIPPKSVVKIKPHYRILLGTGSNVIILLEAIGAGSTAVPTAVEKSRTMNAAEKSLLIDRDISKATAHSATIEKSKKMELDFPQAHFPQEAKKEKAAELRILEAKKQRVIEDIQYKERELDDLRTKIRESRNEAAQMKERAESYHRELQPLEDRRNELEVRVTEVELLYQEKIDTLESEFTELKATLEESQAARMARADKDHKDKLRKLDEEYARKLNELETETTSVQTETEKLRDTFLREKKDLEEALKRVRSESAALEAERHLQQVKIDTEIAHLEGVKMKLENDLEHIRRDREKVSKDIEAKVEEVCAEQERLAEVRREIRAARDEETQVRATISEIHVKEAENIARIEELKLQVSSLEGKVGEISTVLQKAEDDAAEIRRQGHVAAEANAAARLAAVEAQAKAWLQSAESHANSKIQEATADARLQSEKLIQEGDAYLASKKNEGDQFLLETQRRAEQQRSAIQMEIRQIRHQAIADIEAVKEKEAREVSSRLKARTKEIGDQIDRIVGSKLSVQFGLTMDPVSMKAFSNDIHHVVESVIGGSKPPVFDRSFHGNQSTILPVDNAAQVRAVKYWKKVGIAASVVFVLFVSKMLFPGFYSGLGKRIASAVEVKDNTDAVVKRMLRERQLAMTFVTEQDQNFRNTFTDNILYTEGFIEMKESTEAQKVWTLGLNRFFQSDLGLTEKAIVQFGSAEGRMIRELIELRKNIIPASAQLGIQKMRALEISIVKEMKFIVRTDANWEKFENFHKDFYLKYRETFLNRAPASASGTPQSK